MPTPPRSSGNPRTVGAVQDRFSCIVFAGPVVRATAPGRRPSGWLIGSAEGWRGRNRARCHLLGRQGNDGAVVRDIDRIAPEQGVGSLPVAHLDPDPAPPEEEAEVRRASRSGAGVRSRRAAVARMHERPLRRSGHGKEAGDTSRVCGRCHRVQLAASTSSRGQLDCTTSALHRLDEGRQRGVADFRAYNIEVSASPGEKASPLRKRQHPVGLLDDPSFLESKYESAAAGGIVVGCVREVPDRVLGEPSPGMDASFCSRRTWPGASRQAAPIRASPSSRARPRALDGVGRC